MEESSEDHILLFRCIQRDDRAALNTLFSHYYQGLCTFANSFLHNTEEAEECVADVFISLWKNRKSLSIKSNFRAYLYTAVKYSAFACLRKRRPAFEDIDTIPDTMTEDPWGTEQVVLQSELERHVDQAIETLPFRCRQVFRLSREDGLSYKEISEVLNISEKTIENHLARAIQILRKNLRMYRKDTGLPEALTEA